MLIKIDGRKKLQCHFYYIIKDVFSRSYCCYGKLLYHENDNNIFITDYSVFDAIIEAIIQVIDSGDI